MVRVSLTRGLDRQDLAHVESNVVCHLPQRTAVLEVHLGAAPGPGAQLAVVDALEVGREDLRQPREIGRRRLKEGKGPRRRSSARPLRAFGQKLRMALVQAGDRLTESLAREDLRARGQTPLVDLGHDDVVPLGGSNRSERRVGAFVREGTAEQRERLAERRQRLLDQRGVRGPRDCAEQRERPRSLRTSRRWGGGSPPPARRARPSALRRRARRPRSRRPRRCAWLRSHARGGSDAAPRRRPRSARRSARAPPTRARRRTARQRDEQAVGVESEELAEVPLEGAAAVALRARDVVSGR